jgi:hypothetical protein
MQNYKLEDSRWLKSKQIMQLKFKAIEEKAEWKAKFVERYEAEQKELKTQIRIEKIIKFMPEYNRLEISNMSDDYFNMFLAGLEKTYNDKIEADRKAEEKRLKEIEIEKARQEKIRLENIRLQKEIKQRELQIAAEREQVRKENEEKERLAEKERKKQVQILADQQAKADKERAELLAKNQANIEKAEKDRKEKEQLLAKIEYEKQVQIKVAEAAKKAQLAEEKKAKLAPDKTKLLNFMQAINDLQRPEVKSIEAGEIATNANTYLVQCANYIRDNANKL